MPDRDHHYEYERDGQAIYRQSFAIIEAESDLEAVPADLRAVAVRMTHACGMTDIAGALRWSDSVGSAARAALQSGAPILCDSEMVAHGITRKRLPADNAVVCTLRDERVPEIAARIGNTRSAAALDLWLDQLGGAVVAIGNAPTALFRLLELVADGAPRPAAVLGMPVGFVGAIESKEALAEQDLGLEYLTITGRRGGSAMAASAVNALASDAL